MSHRVVETSLRRLQIHRRVTDESQTTTDEILTTKDKSQTNTVGPKTITGNSNYRGVFSAVDMV